jgi:hypothetical protein
MPAHSGRWCGSTIPHVSHALPRFTATMVRCVPSMMRRSGLLAETSRRSMTSACSGLIAYSTPSTSIAVQRTTGTAGAAKGSTG